MRIYLRIRGNQKQIPFNYQEYLTGAFHKWLGKENEVHGQTSLYSFSWLMNVDSNRNGLTLKRDSYFFISSADDGLVKRIVKAVIDDPNVFNNIKVTDIQLRETPQFQTSERFVSASPVLIKRNFEGSEKHILFDDPESGKYLTETLQTKLKLAGMSAEGVSVRFDPEYHSPKVKLIHYKNIGNKTSFCPVIIDGSSEQIAFAWNVGVGNSTGIGFGALK